LAAAEASLTSEISGSLWAAGNRVELGGQVAGSARIAAAEVEVTGSVGNDVLIFAAEATIDEEAVIEGDLLFAGSRLTIEGQVHGKVLTSCDCEVVINGPIGSFEGF